MEGVPGDAPGDLGDGLSELPLALGAKDSSSIMTEISKVEAFTSVIACCVRVRDGIQMLAYGVANGRGSSNMTSSSTLSPVSLSLSRKQRPRVWEHFESPFSSSLSFVRVPKLSFPVRPRHWGETTHCAGM